MYAGSFQLRHFWMRIPPDWFPKNPSWANYTRILGEADFPRWTFNTLVVGFSSIICISFSLLAGYTFAKKEFPGKSFLFWSALITLMLPYHITIIPLYITVRGLGLYDTLPGVFLPGIAGAGHMFLCRQYMSTIPSELIDAARVDGASELKIFTRIIVPICKPLVAALCIFSMVGAWRDYFWPLIITSNRARTLPVAMAQLAARPGGLRDVGLSMAAASLVTIPIFIIFFSFQKYFVRGITLGGIKG